RRRTSEPRQVAPTPDVVVGVDDGRHAALAFAKLRTWAQMLASDPPSPSTSRKGRAALRPAVRGAKPGSPASGVSQTVRQAIREKRGARPPPPPRVPPPAPAPR